MEDNRWSGFGKILGDMALYVYIIGGILLLVIIGIIAMTVSYSKKRKQGEAGSSDSKALVGRRIVLYVLSEVLTFILVLIIAPSFLR